MNNTRCKWQQCKSSLKAHHLYGHHHQYHLSPPFCDGVNAVCDGLAA